MTDSTEANRTDEATPDDSVFRDDTPGAVKAVATTGLVMLILGLATGVVVVGTYALVAFIAPDVALVVPAWQTRVIGLLTLGGLFVAIVGFVVEEATTDDAPDPDETEVSA
jgi:membrane protein implicated in regulation of membrane protease activity